MSTGIGCEACLTTTVSSTGITMAFQPIAGVVQQTVFAHEALLRGTDGRSASEVLAAAGENLYSLVQACMAIAIKWAAALKVPALLSIKFMPNAVYNPLNCLRATVAAAERVDGPLSLIIFEVTEQEKMVDEAHVLSILKAYRAKGLLTAIDDFGAGYSGLSLLAEFQPHFLTLDLALIKDIGTSRTRQALVRHTVLLCE